MGMDREGPWEAFGARLEHASRHAKGSLDKAIAKGAIGLASDIKRNLISSGEFAGAPFRPLSPKTIARKGSSKPLIDTAAMLGAVTSARKEELVYFVGIPGDQTNARGAAIAIYAAAHEFGAITSRGQVIEARPWFRPTVAKVRASRLADIKVEMEKLFR